MWVDAAWRGDDYMTLHELWVGSIDTSVDARAAGSVLWGAVPPVRGLAPSQLYHGHLEWKLSYYNVGFYFKNCIFVHCAVTATLWRSSPPTATSFPQREGAGGIVCSWWQWVVVDYSTAAVPACDHRLIDLSLIHIWRCRRSTLCRSRWSPYH